MKRTESNRENNKNSEKLGGMERNKWWIWWIIGNDTQTRRCFVAKYLICFSINPVTFANNDEFGRIFSWNKHKIEAKLSVSKHWNSMIQADNIQIIPVGNPMFSVQQQLSKVVIIISNGNFNYFYWKEKHKWDQMRSMPMLQFYFPWRHFLFSSLCLSLSSLLSGCTMSKT